MGLNRTSNILVRVGQGNEGGLELGGGEIHTFFEDGHEVCTEFFSIR